jgi:plasmid stability protein
MATLHVRNVPDALYERIQHRAAAERRSITAEVVTLLEEALRRQPEPEAELFARIDRRRQRLLDTVGLFPSSVDLIREDRER